MATTTAPAAKAPEQKYRTIDVAGLKVRVPIEYSPDEWPTVERITNYAQGIFPDRTKKSPERDRAIRGVWGMRESLRTPKGEVRSKSELRPVVSAVLKEIARRNREQAARERKRQRELAHANAKAERAIERLRAKAIAKHPYAKLPDGVKPTRVASSDETRPILTGGLVRKLGRAPKARWVLQVTDTYRLVEIPLEVYGPNPLRDGAYIPREALAAIEKAGGAFRVGADGTVQPLTLGGQHVGAVEKFDSRGMRYSHGVTVTVTSEAGVGIAPQTYLRTPKEAIHAYPAVDKIQPKPAAVSRTLRLTLDAALLAKTAAALGGSKLGHVTLVLDTGDFEKGPDGVKRQRTPIRVATPRGDVIGVQMPVDELKSL